MLITKIKELRPGLFNKLSNPEKVESLHITNNFIKHIPPNTFDLFTNLKNLHITSNVIETLPNNIFDNLSQLEILFINNNNLVSLPKDVFKNLVNLKELYLSGNKLKNLDASVFNSLINLEVLYLSDNQFESMPETVFMSLSNLKELDLIGNYELKVLPGNVFSSLSNLKILRLPDVIPAYFFTDYPRNIKVLLSDYQQNKMHRYRKRVARFKQLFKKIKNAGKTFELENPFTTTWMEICQGGEKDKGKLLDHLSKYTLPDDLDINHLKTLKFRHICGLISENFDKESGNNNFEDGWEKQCNRYDEKEDAVYDLLGTDLKTIVPDVYFYKTDGVTYCFSLEELSGILSKQTPRNPFDNVEIHPLVVREMKEWMDTRKNYLHTMIPKKKKIIRTPTAMVTELISVVGEDYPYIKPEMIFEASVEKLKNIPMAMERINGNIYFDRSLLFNLRNSSIKNDVIIILTDLIIKTFDYYEEHGDGSVISTLFGKILDDSLEMV